MIRTRGGNRKGTPVTDSKCSNRNVAVARKVNVQSRIFSQINQLHDRAGIVNRQRKPLRLNVVSVSGVGLVVGS